MQMLICYISRAFVPKEIRVALPSKQSQMCVQGFFPSAGKLCWVTSNDLCAFFFFFYRKFVKDQKQVQEDISRMSSKAISKVQDDIKSLKQLLSVSASGLQRQALAIDKLKLETAQV